MSRNPARTSASICHAISGLPPTSSSGFGVVSVSGRHQFYTVRLERGVAMPAFKASGDITSMSKADGYIEIPAQTDIVEKGELVDVRLF